MSFIDDMERIEIVVADWMYDTVVKAVSVLSPDGRPYGFEEQTEEEQLQEYFGYRNNKEAWAKYLGDMIAQMTKSLMDSGLNIEQIKSVHIEDIAQKYTLTYSYEMEQLLARNSNGSLPTDSREMADIS